VKTDQGIVSVSRDHALSGIGDQVAGRQTAVSTFVTLRNIVAHSGSPERKADKTGRLASIRYLSSKLVSMKVAQVPLQQRSADANLRAIQIGIAKAKPVIEGVHALLPTSGQTFTVPIK
jgi:hypothetical protein